MKIKLTVLYLATGLVLTLSPMVSMAQSSGQFAVAQPTVPFLPTQAPAIATRAPFRNLPAGSAPVVIVQPPSVVRNPLFNPVFNPGQVFSPTQAFVPNQVFAPTQVFVPNQVFTPNPVFAPANPVFAPTQAFIPNQLVFPAPVSPSFQTPSQVMLPPTQLLVPGQTVVPATTSQPFMAPAAPAQAFFGSSSPTKQQSATPGPGTSRADVLKQFGQPVVTVSTSTGETLYFSDGTKVTLENGQVTGSK